MLNMKSKSLVALTAAAIAFAGIGIVPSQAASAPAANPSAGTGNAAAEITDFSARRHYYYGRRNNAALGTFLAIAGTAAAVALANRHRHHDGYYGYGGPQYGYAPYGNGAPYGYAAPYGYGPRYRGW